MVTAMTTIVSQHRPRFRLHKWWCTNVLTLWYTTGSKGTLRKAMQHGPWILWHVRWLSVLVRYVISVCLDTWDGTSCTCICWCVPLGLASLMTILCYQWGVGLLHGVHQMTLLIDTICMEWKQVIIQLRDHKRKCEKITDRDTITMQLVANRVFMCVQGLALVAAHLK